MNLKNRLIAAVFSANVLFAAGMLSAADWYTVSNQTGCISGSTKDPMFEGLGIVEPVTSATPPTSFAIKSKSPCRDMGLTLDGQRNEVDLFGNLRVKYGCVDMGALECCSYTPGLMISIR